MCVCLSARSRAPECVRQCMYVRVNVYLCTYVHISIPVCIGAYIQCVHACECQYLASVRGCIRNGACVWVHVCGCMCVDGCLGAPVRVHVSGSM